MRTFEPSGSQRHTLLGGLKQLDRWVPWTPEHTNDGVRKKPAAVAASGNTFPVRYDDPENWYSYDEANGIVDDSEDVEGVGIVISASRDDFVVVDFDDCIDPETHEVDTEVWQYVRSAATYAELSFTGTGLHMIFRGTVPNQGWTATEDAVDGEIYDKYFIVVTEDHIAGTPRTAQANNDWLKATYDELDIKWRELFFE